MRVKKMADPFEVIITLYLFSRNGAFSRKVLQFKGRWTGSG